MQLQNLQLRAAALQQQFKGLAGEELQQALASIHNNPANALAWRQGLDLRWCEWSAFAAYVTSPAKWLENGPARARGAGLEWTPARTAKKLEEWRQEDASKVGVGLDNLSVAAYVMRPGVAPFFGQQPVIPGPPEGRGRG